MKSFLDQYGFSLGINILLLLITTAALLQVVLIRKIHFINIKSHEKFSSYQELRDQLSLGEIELSKEVNDLKVVQFIDDKNYKVLKSSSKQ